MKLDASQVRYPGKTGRIGDDRKVRLVPGWIVDVHGLEPLGMRHGHALLVEKVALDPVGVPLHLHRTARHVMQDSVGDVDVVLDEIALGQAHLGEEDLVEIGDLDLAACDEHARQL
ncbi:MAG: hypothetical protein E6I14_04445 [Chloroflexi bacterium]|nr:MAG: hypothetical protein E6I14_04445 [Chloroflexota bacterium]